MSDSSSVDRWHPSNVEELARKWENEARGALSINRTHIAKKLAAEQVRDLVPELVADRGRVLAAARELAEAAEYSLTLPEPPGAELEEAVRAFREVGQ